MRTVMAIVVSLFLTAGMSINDEPPSGPEMQYLHEVMPFNIVRVNKLIALNEVEFEVHMFRGAEPIDVTIRLYTPYSWEMFKAAVEKAALVAASANPRWHNDPTIHPKLPHNSRTVERPSCGIPCT